MGDYDTAQENNKEILRIAKPSYWFMVSFQTLVNVGISLYNNS